MASLLSALRFNSARLSFLHVPVSGAFGAVSVRFATNKAGGSTKNGRDSNPKYRGLKKYGGEEVIPGNIILRQKGNKWYPGENVAEGRDYTLFATAPGYVYFTNDSLRGRRYINVVSKDRYDVLTKLKLLDRARRAAENRDKIWPFMLKDKESALRLTGKAAMPATPASSSKAQKATAATTAR